MVHVFRRLDQDFGVCSVVLETDGAVLTEFVRRHAISIRQDQCPESGPDRNDVVLSRTFAGVNELLQAIQQCQLSCTDPVFDYQQKLRHDGARDMLDGSSWIGGGGHLAVAPAAQQFEDCDSAVQHLVHRHTWLLCTVPLHELAQ